MKGYFFLLCFLYVITAGMSLWSMTFDVPWLLMLLWTANLVLFGLCLKGAYGLAFHKIYSRPERWRVTAQATLLLGLANVFLTGWGDMVGVPTMAGRPGLLDMGLTFLPFLLFAIPNVVYGHELAKDVPFVSKDDEEDEGEDVA